MYTTSTPEVSLRIQEEFKDKDPFDSGLIKHIADAMPEIYSRLGIIEIEKEGETDIVQHLLDGLHKFLVSPDFSDLLIEIM